MAGVAAVAHIDPLLGPLVGAGPDEPLELLIEDHLDGRLHGLPDSGRKIELEVFLRRQQEVSSLNAKGSCWSLQGGASSVSQPRGSPFFLGGPRNRLLHNYTDTTQAAGALDIDRLMAAPCPPPQRRGSHRAAVVRP
jgi:hypothetical protein